MVLQRVTGTRASEESDQSASARDLFDSDTPMAPKKVYWASMIQGSLDRLHLGDLLQWFQMGSLSGRLTLIDQHHKRHLDFLDGEIVYASSTVPEERLASWLATEGVLPFSLLRRLLGISLLRRTLCTALLVDKGGFSPDHLRRSLTRLAETITSRILGSSNVEFVFDPSYPVRQLLGMTISVDPNSLIMNAARRNDEFVDGSWSVPDAVLPLAGEAFDSFFWQLIREGIPDEERVDGEEVARLQLLLRNIMGTLSEWLVSGPGLVPLPPAQAAKIQERNQVGEPADLAGLPHAVWNQMVLACSIHSPHLQHPEALGELLQLAVELDLWDDMTASELWRRPQTGRIDELTERAVTNWTRAARAAAIHIGVPEDTVRLAIPLAVVPTDLVMWVLSTLPVPHRRLRTALLRELPRRIGLGLTHRADFPEPFRRLFDRAAVSPLGTCLHLAREVLPSAQVWPETVPEDESLLLSVASPATLTRAAVAAAQVFAETSDAPAVAG
jgi:hypothetical protein